MSTSEYISVQRYETYNSDFVPNAFGFNNTGNICWGNSLLQMLLSCASLNKVMIENEDKLSGNPLAQEYLFILRKTLPHEFDPMAGLKKPDPTVDAALLGELRVCSSRLLTVMFRELHRRKMQFNFGNRQECVDEAFILFLDLLDFEPINKLFNNKYSASIYCPECKVAVSTMTDPCQRKIEMFLTSAKNIKTEEEFRNYILRHPSMHRGYRCERCNKISAETFRVYCLKMLREVLVITFNKYFLKTTMWFPEQLSFPAKDGSTLRYKLISQIEHSGTRIGGHYWANVVRPDAAGNPKWFYLNDSSVGVGKYCPSPNTYMIMYHMVDDNFEDGAEA